MGFHRRVAPMAAAGAASQSRPGWRLPRMIRFLLLLLVLLTQLKLVACEEEAEPATPAANNVSSTLVVLDKRACPKKGVRQPRSIDGLPTHVARLYERGTKTRSWDDCLTTGTKLLKDFRKTSPRENRRLASPFKSSRSLDKWGWVQFLENKLTKPVYGKKLDPAFREKKRRVWPRFSRLYTSEHINCYIIDGKIRIPSNGIYSNVMNPESGVIIADYNFGPSIQAPELPPSKLPKLKNWSDLVYFQWADACARAGITKRYLRYIYRANIINMDTLAIIARALRTKERTKFPSWSNRVTFSMTSTAGKAILGTLHGVGPGYLLTQHKAELGNKEITEVTVWDSYGPSEFDAKGTSVNLRFKVRNIEPLYLTCCEGPLETLESCNIKQYDLCYYRLINLSY